MIFTAKIEQTFAYQKRMKYIAKTDSFIEKSGDSLSYVRNVRQPYGWLKESGTPPCEHLDVIVMTDKEYELGDEDKVKIIGVFCRNDGDHKLVGVRVDRDIHKYLRDMKKSPESDYNKLYDEYSEKYSIA